MHKFIRGISFKVWSSQRQSLQTACVLVCPWFSHLLESFLLIPPFASYFHHYPSDATTQHPPRQLLPSEVTHESKSMQSNSSLWSIISNLKSSSHYLRSFMHVACEENHNLQVVCRRSGCQTFCICKCIRPWNNSFTAAQTEGKQTQFSASFLF